MAAGSAVPGLLLLFMLGVTQLSWVLLDFGWEAAVCGQEVWASSRRPHSLTQLNTQTLAGTVKFLY